MGGLSLIHWVVVLLVVVLIFGTSKLRNIGKDLGAAVHDFKKGLNEGSGEETAIQNGDHKNTKDTGI